MRVTYMGRAGTTNGYTCVACGNIACAAGQYRSGSCDGTANGYVCRDQPTCGESDVEYLDGASATSAGACQKQPTCEGNTYLTGASPTLKGVCTVCEGTQNVVACAVVSANPVWSRVLLHVPVGLCKSMPPYMC